MIQKTIPSLNGLRSISIFMVIGYHLDHNNFLSTNNAMHYLSMALFNGPLGVNVFFIISGFLISSLLIREEFNTGRISFRNFYIRRIIRIFPAYYFLLFIYFLLQLLGYIHLSPIDWLSSLTFTKQFFKTPTYEVGHLWSLSVEEVFYLLWPFFFVNVKKQATNIIIGLMALFTVLRILFFDFPASITANTIFSTGDSLLLGCLLAINYEPVSRWVMEKKNYIFSVIVGLFLSVLTYKYVYNQLIKTPDQVLFLQVGAILYGLFGSIGLVTNLMIGFIIIYSINVRNPWFIILNSTFMNHIGKLSYSIYLWQQILVSDREITHSLPIVCLIGLIYSMAYFSYYLIENPFLKLKEKFTTKSQPIERHSFV